MLAMRVSRPEAFAMTCGVIVPANAVLIDEVLEEVQGRVRGEPDAIANDRRFATAIYRIAVMSGIMDQIGFASPGRSPLHRPAKWLNSSSAKAPRRRVQAAPQRAGH